MKKPKILFFVNVDWFFISHRLPIALEAFSKGFEVHIATTFTDKRSEIESLGFYLHEINVSRGSFRLFESFQTLMRVIQLFKKVQPQIVHLVTIKPIILGGIAARISHIQCVVAAISGLGYIFIDQGAKASIRRFFIRFLYKLALTHKNIKIICQNKNDLNVIQKISNLPSDFFSLIPGSGVCLNKFKFYPDKNEYAKIILASRMLKDKGIYEFVDAAKIIQKCDLKAQFILVGDPDHENPTSLNQQQLNNWEKEGILEAWGHQENMHEILSMASIVVLPSYREGFPKVLIEAAACGRAIITTDVPGCRDAINNGVTGILVPAKDPVALAEAITSLIKDPKMRLSMGESGRKMAEERFNETHVINEHFNIYNQLLIKNLQT
jgi:glycosyltransferase involved in cell wall biosynthesis